MTPNYTKHFYRNTIKQVLKNTQESERMKGAVENFHRHLYESHLDSRKYVMIMVIANILTLVILLCGWTMVKKCYKNMRNMGEEIATLKEICVEPNKPEKKKTNGTGG